MILDKQVRSTRQDGRIIGQDVVDRWVSCVLVFDPEVFQVLSKHVPCSQHVKGRRMCVPKKLEGRVSNR